MQAAPDVATAHTWFEALQKDGDVIQPFEKTFFSPGFGMVRDKFGTSWIISVVPQQN
jgi:PhnB protein